MAEAATSPITQRSFVSRSKTDMTDPRSFSHLGPQTGMGTWKAPGNSERDFGDLLGGSHQKQEVKEPQSLRDSMGTDANASHPGPTQC